MADVTQRLAENIARVRERIAAAAQASGRAAADVTLVAVTKYVSTEITRAIAEAGCPDLGESRPQDLWSKAAEIADHNMRWHFIGHLQRNKVRRTLPLVSLLHSIDSPRLLASINEEAAAAGIVTQGLLEVNISGETAKHGLAPDEIEPLLASLPGLTHVRIRGLMAMAGLEGGEDAAERDFARLRALRDRLVPLVPEGVSLDQLSMGMSGDFEAAIRQGATLVRVGSALCEGLEQP